MLLVLIMSLRLCATRTSPRLTFPPIPSAPRAAEATLLRYPGREFGIQVKKKREPSLFTVLRDCSLVFCALLSHFTSKSLLSFPHTTTLSVYSLCFLRTWSNWVLMMDNFFLTFSFLLFLLFPLQKCHMDSRTRGSFDFLCVCLLTYN